MLRSTEKLWDPLIRLFHWSVASIFFINYVVNEPGGSWHQWLGYMAVAWLLIRFIWGFVGSGAARWSDFFPTYRRLSTHIAALAKGEHYHRFGHTPLGALLMILMMLGILLLGLTGYLMQEVDYFWGDERINLLHEWIAHTLGLLVALHTGAALYESFKLKENLILTMITGKRKRPD